MDIAVKQRILGGVVLVAAAILFLPVVLEGAGVKALQPPAPPAPPTTPTTQDLAPALQKQAQGLAKDISASHGEPTFYPVVPAASEGGEAVPAVASGGADDKLAEQQLAANQAAEQLAQAKAQAEADAAAQAKRDNAVSEKSKAAEAKAAAAKAADAKAAEAKLAAAKATDIKAATDKKALADKAAIEKAATEKAAAEKAAAAKLANEKKAAAEKLAAEKAQAEKAVSEKASTAPATSADPDPALPQAWVVQVARLNAQDKANALVEKLRARGYRATATGSGDSWRVIIGPELEKAAAESVKRKLAEDPQLKLSGWIQAYRP